MTLTIGEVAKQTGLSPKAIRLYEAHGLIPPPQRTQAGYRTYDQHDLALLRFIGQARALDLRLEEIKEILDLQQASGQPCGRVLELLNTHIADIDRTIQALQNLRATLVRARDTAKASSRRGEQAVVCRLIEAQAPPRSTATG
jgi:MerR family transcriptional regulator, copper efflux regulator